MPKFACGPTQLVRDKLDEDFLDGQGNNKLAPTFEERFILLPSSRRGVRPLGKLIHIVAAINHTGLTLGGRFGCSAGGVSVLANRRAVVGAFMTRQRALGSPRIIARLLRSFCALSDRLNRYSHSPIEVEH